MDPGAEEQAFPVYVDEIDLDETGGLLLDSRDTPTSDRDLTDFVGCTAVRIEEPSGAVTLEIFDWLLARSSVPFNLTDTNWDRGVARDNAGFFVAGSERNRHAFEKAGFVRFADGEVREILNLQSSSEYINVNLSGDLLDPDSAGYPREFELLK